MIFVDTGAFIGHYIEKDDHRDAAILGWRELKAKPQPLFTSSFVIDELLTYLGRRAGYRFAAERGRALFASATLVLLRPSPEDELLALDHFEKYADQEVSFTDCVSFALMQREGIRRVFTFDRHFELAGFEPWPRKPLRSGTIRRVR